MPSWRLAFLMMYFVFASFISNAQNTSTIRQNYLDQVAPKEYLIAGIDLKWNWIENDPVEDSIAVSQGWYQYMGARKQELQNEIESLRAQMIFDYHVALTELLASNISLQTSVQSDISENISSQATHFPDSITYLSSDTSQVELLKEWLRNYQSEFWSYVNLLEEIITQN